MLNMIYTYPIYLSNVIIDTRKRYIDVIRIRFKKK